MSSCLIHRNIKSKDGSLNKISRFYCPCVRVSRLPEYWYTITGFLSNLNKESLVPCFHTPPHSVFFHIFLISSFSSLPVTCVILRQWIKFHLYPSEGAASNTELPAICMGSQETCASKVRSKKWPVRKIFYTYTVDFVLLYDTCLVLSTIFQLYSFCGV
jgi:hypothetical protein